MSRSYKKVAGFNSYQKNRTKWAKRQASKAVRRDNDISNGTAFKKCYYSWNIFDFRSHTFGFNAINDLDYPNYKIFNK